MDTVFGWRPVIGSVMAVAAIGLAGWTLFTGTGRRGLPGCGAGSGCHEVAKGRWSRVGPIPVALLGLCTYVMLLAGIINRDSATTASPLLRSEIGSAVAWTAIGAAAWFIFLQATIIRRWCVYCVLTHIFAVTAAVILLRTAGSNSPLVLICASCAVVTMVATQIMWKPKRFKIVEVSQISGPAPSNEVPPAIAVDPVTEQLPVPGHLAVYPRKHRNVTLLGGRVKLDTFDFPILGSPDAANLYALLVDFTCEECHHLHRLVRSAVEHYDGQLAVAIVTIPLHEGCNPTVKCHRQPQAYACNFVRLAWRIWLADPAAYAAWDAFLAEPPDNQPFGLALLKAKELADVSQFKPGEPDAVVDQIIAKCVGMFQSATSPKIPAMLLNRGILQGHVADLNGLQDLLTPHLKSNGISKASAAEVVT